MLGDLKAPDKGSKFNGIEAQGFCVFPSLDYHKR